MTAISRRAIVATTGNEIAKGKWWLVCTVSLLEVDGETALEVGIVVVTRDVIGKKVASESSRATRTVSLAVSNRSAPDMRSAVSLGVWLR